MGRVIGIWRGEDGTVHRGPAARNDAFIPVLHLFRERGLLARTDDDPPYLVPAELTKTRDDADWVRRSLYLAGRYYCSCGARTCTRKHGNIEGCPDGGQRLGVQAHIVKDRSGRFRVQLRVFDKTEATRQVVAQYGSDPSAWPYQARARKLKGK